MDRERVLARIDELDGYLRELHEIMPLNFEDYRSIEKRRACERLLQVCIECVIDISALIVTGLRLGLPSEEDDLFEKLEQAKIISSTTKETLKRMKGLQNILVYEYGRVDDRLVYDILKNKLGDFEAFKKEILQSISSQY